MTSPGRSPSTGSAIQGPPGRHPPGSPHPENGETAPASPCSPARRCTAPRGSWQPEADRDQNVRAHSSPQDKLARELCKPCGHGPCDPSRSAANEPSRVPEGTVKIEWPTLTLPVRIGWHSLCQCRTLVVFSSPGAAQGFGTSRKILNCSRPLIRTLKGEMGVFLAAGAAATPGGAAPPKP